MEEKGGLPRVHRNTMFFLVPMLSERAAFGSSMRRFLAYQALQSDITLKLTPEQTGEVKGKLETSRRRSGEGLRNRLYRQIHTLPHALVSKKTISASPLRAMSVPLTRSL